MALKEPLSRNLGTQGLAGAGDEEGGGEGEGRKGNKIRLFGKERQMCDTFLFFPSLLSSASILPVDKNFTNPILLSFKLESKDFFAT